MFHVGGIQRIAVSGGIFDIKTVGDDQVLIIGFGEGRTTLLIWLSSGARRSTAISVVTAHTPKPVPVKGAKQRADRISQDGGVTHGEVEVFQIPEELHDLHQVPGADGGVLVIEGFNSDGQKRTLTLTPRR